MKKVYTFYGEVTKEILDGLQVGDLVKVNDWEKPMKIQGTTEHYAVMTQKIFGKVYYSVIEKKPWGGIRYNSMRGGYFHCGPDHWVLGWCGDFDYKFTDKNQIKAYLDSFESGESEISQRRAIPIYSIWIKKA